MSGKQNWFTIDGADSVDTPALLIFPARVKYNIQLAVSMIGDASRLRPHIKTHKSADVIKLSLEAGITKFKCATIAEAELLGMCGAPDVLLAYQPNGPKAGRFIALVKKYPATNFSCLIDNEQSANSLSVLAIQNDIVIDVYTDINVGMNRTGIAAAKAFELIERISGLKGLHITGLHGYDGHIHDADQGIRDKQAAAVYAALTSLRDRVRENLKTDLIIVAGGTPTYPFFASKNDIICSPGTFVYWDAGYSETCTEQKFLPAAVLMTRVVSLPDDVKVCLDMGHKSVAAENPIDKRLHFLNAPDLTVVSQSEEHLVCEAPKTHNYVIGDIIYALPYHICPTVALHEKALTIENHLVSGAWAAPARNRKINI